MKEPGSATRKLVDRHMKSHGVKPKIAVETNNTECIKELVKQGESISFLARRIVEKDIDEGTLEAIPLKPEGLLLAVGIAYLKNQRLSPVAKTFTHCLPHMLETQRPYFRKMQGLGIETVKL
jgi:DNA-binding transcriptional LysR family regulator